MSHRQSDNEAITRHIYDQAVQRFKKRRVFKLHVSNPVHAIRPLRPVTVSGFEEFILVPSGS